MSNPNISAFDADAKLNIAHEKTRLHSDAAYVGGLSITLTLVMQYAYSFFVKILMSCGVLTRESIAKDFLGMNNTAFLAFYSFVYVFSLLVPAIIVSFLFNKRFIPFAPAKPVSFGFAFWSVIGAAGMCMFSNILNGIVQSFFQQMGADIPDAPQLMVNTPTSLILNLFTIAVLPALLEEMIYRGYILRTLRPYGDGFAVLISAMLFSLMHGNLRQIPFAFIVGLFLGFLYVQTNNIWIPIVVHFINNGISVAMEYLSLSLSDAGMSTLYVLVTYGLIVLGLIATLVLLLAYRTKLHIPPHQSSMSFWRRMGVIFTSPLFLTSVAMYLIFLYMGM